MSDLSKMPTDQSWKKSRTGGWMRSDGADVRPSLDARGWVASDALGCLVRPDDDEHREPLVFPTATKAKWYLDCHRPPEG